MPLAFTQEDFLVIHCKQTLVQKRVFKFIVSLLISFYTTHGSTEIDDTQLLSAVKSHIAVG